MIVGSIKIHLAKYHCNFIQPRPKRCLARGKLLGRSFKSGFDFQVNCLCIYLWSSKHRIPQWRFGRFGRWYSAHFILILSFSDLPRRRHQAGLRGLSGWGRNPGIRPEGFWLKELSSFLEDLRTFPVLGCIQKNKMVRKEKAIRRFQQPTKKNLSTKKIQKFREFLEGVLSVLPPTVSLAGQRFQPTCWKSWSKIPGGCHVQGVVDLPTGQPSKTPEKTYIVVGRHRLKFLKGGCDLLSTSYLSNLKQVIEAILEVILQSCIRLVTSHLWNVTQVLLAQDSCVHHLIFRTSEVPVWKENAWFSREMSLGLSNSG